MTSRIISTLGFFILFILSTSLIGCGGGGGGGSPSGGGGGGSPAVQPNVRVTAVVFDPVAPVVGQTVTVTIGLAYADVAAATPISVLAVRQETGATAATMTATLNAGAGTTTTQFTFVADGPTSFYVAADSTNALVNETSETDNNLVTTTIVGTPSTSANLTFLSATFAPGNAVANQNVTGTITFGYSNVQNFVSTVTTVTRLGGGLPVRMPIDVPSGSGVLTQTFNTTVDANGRLEFDIIVDANGNLSETNESDNERVVSFTPSGSNLPNLRYLSATYTPTNATQGQNVTLTFTFTFTNFASATTVTNTARRVETGVVTNLAFQIPAGTGVLSQDMTFVRGSSNDNFAITLDATNVVAESDETDNAGLFTSAIPSQGSPIGDLVQSASGTNDFLALKNLGQVGQQGQHFGEPLAEAAIYLNTDAPSPIQFDTTGQRVPIDTAGTAQWGLDKERLGDWRYGVKAKRFAGDFMFLLPASLTGNPFYKPVGVANSGDMNIAFRVIATANGRSIIPIAEGFVRPRPYQVRNDPQGNETSRDPQQTECYVDYWRGVRGTLYIDYARSAHLTSTLSSSTGVRGVYKLDPQAFERYTLNNTDVTATYDEPRDQLSVDLSSLTTNTDHFIQVGLTATGQNPVIIDALSFGSKDVGGNLVPTHSLFDPNFLTKLIHLKWDNTRKRWVSSRLG